MNSLLLYIVKVAVCLATFYLIYFLFLSRDTMYNRNRYFILLSFLTSLTLPLIIIETSQPLDIQFFGKDLTGVIIDGSPDPSSAVKSPTDWNRLFLIIYLSGIIISGLKLLTEVSRILLLILRQKNLEGDIIRLTGHKTSGFSAFGYIFIDAGLSSDEADEIIRHEQKHLDRYHFFDIMFTELLKILQWFNPFLHMFDRSLRAVHEYQADEECLNSGIPVISYQGLMLNQVFSTRVFSAANRFSNPTLIKKRMIMMTKKRSKALANLKIIMVLPVLVLLLFSFSTCAKKSFDSFSGTEALTPVETEISTSQSIKPMAPVKEGDAYVIVEQMPQFPGGDGALLKFIAENTQYPKEAKDNNIQGRVIIRFKIMEDGMVKEASVIKGVDPILDAEALRVVGELPQFTPGLQDGKPVPVYYMVPITYTLSGKSTAVPPPPPPPPSDASDILSEPFVVVEEMPIFPGGDAALLTYISGNVKYPESAKEKKIMGRVILRFCVNETGNVDRVSVLKGVDPVLDAEALRVVSTLPQFQPGKQGGVAVPVWYMVPVTFTLKEESNLSIESKPVVEDK